MNDLGNIADSILFRLKPFLEEEVRLGHIKLEQLYRSGMRDGTELSLVLAEIIAIKNFLLKLEKKANKANMKTKEEVENARGTT